MVLDSPAGRIVKNIVIPAISLLQTRCPLRLNSLLQAKQLDQIGATEDSLCGDLDLSDRLFDSLKVK